MEKKNLLLFIGCFLLTSCSTPRPPSITMQVNTQAELNASPATTSTVSPTLPLASTIAPSETPTVSPTPLPYGGGKGILLVSKNNELILYDSNQGTSKPLMDSVQEYAWSPDGSQIAALTKGGSLPEGVYIINLSDQSHKLIDGRSNIFRIKWSPDGSILAYLVPDRKSYLFQMDITLYMLDGSSPLALHTISDYTGYSNDFSIDIAVFDYAFTQDQSNVYFSAIYGGSHTSYLYRIRGTQWYKFPVRVLPNNFQGSLDNLKWSPDGKKMALVNCDEGNIYLYDPIKSVLQKVTNFSSNTGSTLCIMTVEWMKDGQGIVFSRGSIYSINTDGSSQKQLTNPGWTFSPSISPDGKMIAYSDGQDVYGMKIDGTNTFKLTAGESVAWQPGMK